MYETRDDTGSGRTEPRTLRFGGTESIKYLKKPVSACLSSVSHGESRCVIQCSHRRASRIFRFPLSVWDRYDTD